MKIPEIGRGGYEPNDQQLEILRLAGYPLDDPIEYHAPETIDEWRKTWSNNFISYFWFNGPDTPDPEQRNKYFSQGVPCFERLRVLYPDFVEATRHIVASFAAIDLDMKYHHEEGGKLFTPQEYNLYKEDLLEPRLFTAWTVISRLVSGTDPDYLRKLEQYPGISPSQAVRFLLFR